MYKYSLKSECISLRLYLFPLQGNNFLPTVSFLIPIWDGIENTRLVVGGVTVMKYRKSHEIWVHLEAIFGVLGLIYG